MMPTYETLHKQTAEIIHNGNSCTSWEAAQEMAEEVLQALLESLPKPVDGYQNKHDMYYRQLLEMRE